MTKFHLRPFTIAIIIIGILSGLCLAILSMLFSLGSTANVILSNIGAGLIATAFISLILDIFWTRERVEAEREEIQPFLNEFNSIGVVSSIANMFYGKACFKLVGEERPMEMKRAGQFRLLDLPINEEVCFTTNKNKYSEKMMKQQSKILESFSPFLKKILSPGEEILLAVKATSPMGVLEQITIGWIIVYVKRCVLIFTNKRILHFPTKANFSPKQSVAQVWYGDVEEIKLSGFLGRTLKMKYKSGKKEKFYYLPSREFKKLKTLIPNLATGTSPSIVQERHHLCPKCIVPLQKNVFSCPNCHLGFKNLKQAIRLSLLFPGGGYFYAGHPIMGIGDAIVETILLVSLISLFISAFAAPGPSAAWAGIIPIAFVLSVEKLITIYDTKHFINEYIPVDKGI